MDKFERPRVSRRCCYTCCGLLVVLLIAVAVLAIILKVLLKPKDVSVKVSSITLQEFDATLGFPSFFPNVTLVMDMDVHVYNPNRASFKFTNSSVFMFYHGEQAAETLIPAGKIPARGAVNISTVLTLDALSVVLTPQFGSDTRNGILPVTTQSQIKGRVNVWNILKHRMVSISKCEILLSTFNRTIISYNCDNKNVF